jgi:hypothetical protein
LAIRIGNPQKAVEAIENSLETRSQKAEGTRSPATLVKQEL